MKWTTLHSLALAALLFGCSKSGGGGNQNGSQPNYVGRWSFANKINWHTYNGVLYKDTIIGKTGEYIEFKSDGTVTQAYFDGQSNLQTYTMNYQVIGGRLICNDFPGESKLSVSGSTLTIDASEPSNAESLWWHFRK